MSNQVPLSDLPITPESEPEIISNATTLVDFAAVLDAKSGIKELPATPGAPIDIEKAQVGDVGCKIKLSQRKKWSLLVMFSLAMFVDVWSFAAFFIFTSPISTDLGVPFEQQSWVITAYSVTFSAFLLFWGRVSDLYSAKPVFTYGFIVLGVLNLVISFLPDKYSFFVLRAISGIAGACLIPASFRLIAAVFEPDELGKAFTLYSMSGPIANTSGIIVAGFIDMAPGTGQAAAWRWFFRMLAIMILPVAVASLFFVPAPTGDDAGVEGKWKRLDLVGVMTMLLAIIFLILGLTLGASNGWRTAGFLVPFLLSCILFPLFFVWEARLPEEYALLPSSVWRIPNFAVLAVVALYIYGWWTVNFLAFAEIFINIKGESSIIAAIRLLPEGVIALSVTLFLTFYPQFASRPRWPIAIGLLLSIIACVLFTRSTTQVGTDYWSWLFSALTFGSAGLMVAMIGANVGIMTSVPAEMGGVAGATLQTALRVGSAVALSIQSGLLTVDPGSIGDYDNVRASFYFEIGWGIVWLVGFLGCYRPNKISRARWEQRPNKGIGR